jgi:hypothetical protein
MKEFSGYFLYSFHFCPQEDSDKHPDMWSNFYVYFYLYIHFHIFKIDYRVITKKLNENIVFNGNDHNGSPYSMTCRYS